MDYVFDETLSPFNQELHVLDWFQRNFTTNPKKLKKMNERIRPQLPTWIQKSLCDTLARSADPVKFMRHAFRDLAAYPAIMARLIAEGNHGMIMMGPEVFGFSLDTNEKWLNADKTGKWTQDDESDIIDKALQYWMIKERRRKVTCRITLFADFGFSGIPYETTHKLSDRLWNELLPHWKKEDEARDNLELQYLLNPELREQQNNG